MNLRKIPLGPFIEILTDLFENGADFIDLSGNDDEDAPRDSVKITVKPEYLSSDNEEEEEEEEEDLLNGGMNFLIENKDDKTPPSLSEDDIEDLI